MMVILVRWFPLNGEIYRWNVRLTGYDTPEMRPPRSQENREEEIKAAYAARDFLRGKVMNQDQLVYIKCGEFDKYAGFCVHYILRKMMKFQLMI